jgi:hypothetical protein
MSGARGTAGPFEEAVQGGLGDDRSEHAACEGLPGERGEEAPDGVGPGGGGRDEAEHDTRRAGQAIPFGCHHFRVRVGKRA